MKFNCKSCYLQLVIENKNIDNLLINTIDIVCPHCGSYNTETFDCQFGLDAAQEKINDFYTKLWEN